MNHKTGSAVVVLETGLFPDAESLEPALVLLSAHHDLKRFVLTVGGLSEEDWDRLVLEILSASKVITV